MYSGQSGSVGGSWHSPTLPFVFYHCDSSVKLIDVFLLTVHLGKVQTDTILHGDDSILFIECSSSYYDIMYIHNWIYSFWSRGFPIPDLYVLFINKTYYLQICTSPMSSKKIRTVTALTALHTAKYVLNIKFTTNIL